MAKVSILPDLVRDRIAAGEVVERPASAVKELVENSLDAGATRVDVDIERGGKRRIRVADDGCGMSPEDLALAVERFATSKISSEKDLAGIVIVNNRKPNEDTIEKAKEEQVPLLCTSLKAFDVSGKLYSLLDQSDEL